ncbi:unnamed protein product [Rangifer tarandus platyrhynchus]|uniref:Uncharacterized protein n=2 Tax=Rangifer tarandus platyrhynchus TaxID=3082113 RepID=A0ABN8Y6P0_RANTA|nr:unnamed protein product [Rangifer tarandus platyrhynchus]CAI9693237.1 unnamed protein product [Rangifer tarandus platyrhynchus]
MVLENRPAVLLPVWLMCLLALSRKPSQFCFGSKAVWTQHMEHSHISLSGFGEGPLPGSLLPRTCASPALRLVGPLPARRRGAGLGLTSREIVSRGRGRRSERLTGGVCAAAMFGCYAVAWETGCA